MEIFITQLNQLQNQLVLTLQDIPDYIGLNDRILIKQNDQQLKASILDIIPPKNQIVLFRIEGSLRVGEAGFSTVKPLSIEFNPEAPEPFWRGSYNFFCDQDRLVIDGKSYVPNSLTVRVYSRSQAWELANQLMNYLQHTDRNENEPLDLLFFGALNENTDET